MPYTAAFSGVTDAQITLVEYWKNRRADCGRVMRTDIDPGTVRAYLSSISIVEMTPEGDARFRLVGSRTRDSLGEDPRGKSINEVSGIDADMFTQTLSAALDNGHPIGGVIERDDGTMSWLRLPLVGDDGHWSQVMCYDELVSSLNDRA
jgi:hypothetical protein